MSIPLSNCLGVDSSADAVRRVESIDTAIAAVREAAERQLPLYLLAGASNVILLRRLHGLVLHMGIRGKAVTERTRDHVRLRVGAGEIWHDLVMWTLAQDIAGLENLALIPGSVGAAPIQNIGAYGVEVSEFVEAVEAVRLSDGEPELLSGAECGFAYRDSRFKREGAHLITALQLKLPVGRALVTSYGPIAELMQAQTPQALAAAVMQTRRSKLPDPAEHGNVGSFFKNPIVSARDADALRSRVADLVRYPAADGSVKLAAGQLIDQAGWRGESRYGVKVWPGQALVLVNNGARYGHQFLQMADDIATDIADRFGVRLEREPVVMGEEKMMMGEEDGEG